MAERESQLPTKEQIAERAYELYVQKGGVDGGDVEDWIEAEKQLYKRYFSEGKENQPQRESAPKTPQASKSREAIRASTSDTSGRSVDESPTVDELKGSSRGDKV